MEGLLVSVLADRPNQEVPLNDIVKAMQQYKPNLNFTELKKQVNSELYKMKTKGRVERFAEANNTKPRWILLEDGFDVEARLQEIEDTIQALEQERQILLNRNTKPAPSIKKTTSTNTVALNIGDTSTNTVALNIGDTDAEPQLPKNFKSLKQ